MKRPKKGGTITLTFDASIAVELEDYAWDEELMAFEEEDDPQAAALQYIADMLDGEDIDNAYGGLGAGRAWLTSVENGSVI